MSGGGGLLTERDLSARLGRTVAAPIRIGALGALGVDEDAFLAHLAPHFEHLADDVYLRRESMIQVIRETLPMLHVEYRRTEAMLRLNMIDDERLEAVGKALEGDARYRFVASQRVTRQRSIARFAVRRTPSRPEVTRVPAGEFRQVVDDTRRAPRTFVEASAAAVEAPIVMEVLRAFAKLVFGIHPETDRLNFTLHLMRSLPHAERLAENAPEGIHEDGVAYIVSALVVARENLRGAVSEIHEQLPDGSRVLLHEQTLQPGEFIFQADTGEEARFGNDLWHYVTPVALADAARPGWRDILGLDIELA